MNVIRRPGIPDLPVHGCNIIMPTTVNYVSHFQRFIESENKWQTVLHNQQLICAVFTWFHGNILSHYKRTLKDKEHCHCAEHGLLTDENTTLKCVEAIRAAGTSKWCAPIKKKKSTANDNLIDTTYCEQTNSGFFHLGLIVNMKETIKTENAIYDEINIPIWVLKRWCQEIGSFFLSFFHYFFLFKHSHHIFPLLFIPGRTPSLYIYHTSLCLALYSVYTDCCCANPLLRPDFMHGCALYTGGCYLIPYSCINPQMTSY